MRVSKIIPTTRYASRNVLGRSLDPVTKEPDTTEGLGAFEEVISLGYKLGKRNLDLGGGSSNQSTDYLRGWGIENMVWDPYQRSGIHNKNVLESAKTKGVQSVTSFSVLNVIEEKQKRHEHLQTIKRYVDAGAVGYVKVWEGDKTGAVASPNITGYQFLQTNMITSEYREEIEAVFEKSQIFFDVHANMYVLTQGIGVSR